MRSYDMTNMIVSNKEDVIFLPNFLEIRAKQCLHGGSVSLDLPSHVIENVSAQGKGRSSSTNHH